MMYTRLRMEATMRAERYESGDNLQRRTFFDQVTNHGNDGKETKSCKLFLRFEYLQIDALVGHAADDTEQGGLI